MGNNRKVKLDSGRFLRRKESSSPVPYHEASLIHLGVIGVCPKRSRKSYPPESCRGTANRSSLPFGNRNSRKQAHFRSTSVGTIPALESPYESVAPSKGNTASKLSDLTRMYDSPTEVSMIWQRSAPPLSTARTNSVPSLHHGAKNRENASSNEHSIFAFRATALNYWPSPC